MHIVVVIPNAAWRNTAGVRIRYERIRPWLEAAGHRFSLQPIDEAMLAINPLGDLYLISKCHDVRALLLTQRLRAEGCPVGIDFFDDYYSQGLDPAFVHLRSWFRAMVRVVDFGLCSTPNMHDRLAELAPDLPLLVMNDPSCGWDRVAVAAALEATQKRALDTKMLDIGWFGIGDNPYFALGLDDLQAFSSLLLQCRVRGFQPRLRIITNRRALDKRRLEMIARLPVPCVVDEWSEEAEVALIADSFFCFLPVNGQEFSTVKSLNRAVSVLAGGSQVLSAGFPLYQPLNRFVYRDLDVLLDDLIDRRLRVRASTLPGLEALMARLGSAEVEAGHLSAFFEGVAPPAPQDWPSNRTVMVMHGNRSSGDIHKQVLKRGYLTIGSPRTTACLNFDLSTRCDPEGAFVDVVLRPRAVAQLSTIWQPRVSEIIPAAGGDPELVIRLTRDDLPGLRPMRPLSVPPLRLEELSRYRGDMALMAEIVSLLFARPQLFLSETNSPYWSPEAEALGNEAADV